MKTTDLVEKNIELAVELAEARITTPSQGVIIDRYYKALVAMRRLEKLNEAVDPGHSDDVIIRCELTAGDIRAVMACLYPNGQSASPVAEGRKE